MTQKEINNFLTNTKVYVAGKSEEIQKKLFPFGYYWSNERKMVCCTEKPFLYLAKSKEITYGSDMKFFTEHRYREVSAEEILSLELTGPTYRPFKDAEECWQEMLKHQPFGWLFHKKSKAYKILFKSDYTVDRYNALFNEYEFADNKPFGIKED